jgi:hypothetical protein
MNNHHADDDAEVISERQTSPAQAFNDLRDELAVSRLAIGGLVAKVENMADYGPVLANFREVLEHNSEVINAMAGRFEKNNDRLTRIARAPALELMADDWGEKIAAAGEYARRLDHAAFEKAVTDLYKSMRELADWTESARTRDQQNKRLYLTAVGTFVLTAVFFVGLIFLVGSFPSLGEAPAATHQAPVPAP